VQMSQFVNGIEKEIMKKEEFYQMVKLFDKVKLVNMTYLIIILAQR
jgi:hypothetical protein